MGGFASGRRWQTKHYPRDTETKRIDAAYLNRQGHFVDGYLGWVRWTRNGEPSGNISFRISGDLMTLDYRCRFNGGDWQPVEQFITLERTPCNYGGSRVWFQCPNCGLRCRVLYLGHQRFLCRHCSNIRYDSQQQSATDRAIAKRWELHNQLFGDSKRRMWGKTRAKLMKQFIAAEIELDQHLERVMKSLYGDTAS